MPRIIAIVVSAGKATLKELQTYYGLEDVYNLVEVIMVDGENERRMIEQAKRPHA